LDVLGLAAMSTFDDEEEMAEEAVTQIGMDRNGVTIELGLSSTER